MHNQNNITVDTTTPRWLNVLADKCKEHGQRKVAETLGISKTQISQAINNKYPGDMAKLETRVRGAYLGHTVGCPILGELETNKCLQYQKQTLNHVNPMRVQLFRACNGKCPHSQKNKD
ncbi:Uncharacterised protein [BD1-7 clade bacterium]|uniref:Uncharacterized protein n=1 Tax=BD1-7 clade bacterium TaxID=2029982 RepID=A0A5S9P361_9GAMM|nr:Uncharacterised protein [BD1-7 clade bacterium]CAA0122908.1 Uncharacterised protein [BD1-7 clade bacterium]